MLDLRPGQVPSRSPKGDLKSHWRRQGRGEFDGADVERPVLTWVAVSPSSQCKGQFCTQMAAPPDPGVFGSTGPAPICRPSRWCCLASDRYGSSVLRSPGQREGGLRGTRAGVVGDRYKPRPLEPPLSIRSVSPGPWTPSGGPFPAISDGPLRTSGPANPARIYIGHKGGEALPRGPAGPGARRRVRLAGKVVSA